MNQSRPKHIIYGIVSIDQTKGYPRLFVGSVLVRTFHTDHDTAEAIRLAKELSMVIELEKQDIKREMEQQFRSTAAQIRDALGVYGHG